MQIRPDSIRPAHAPLFPVQVKPHRRRLHRVSVDGIEFIFLDVVPALRKFAQHPEAKFDTLTLH